MFVALTLNECPCTKSNTQGCDLAECHPNMSNNQMCEANKPLPDGNSDYNIGNCPGAYDVFKCVKGK